MKIVITGISSYFAQFIFPLLEKENSITQILGIDLRNPSFNSPKLDFTKRDIRDKDLTEFLRGYDTLLHLAFIVSPLKDRREIYSINIEGSKNIINCAVDAGITHIIHISSVAVYGSFPDNPVPITEDHLLRIMSDHFYYNETKVIVERFLDKIELNNPSLIITRFRPHVVLGQEINNILAGMFTGRVITTRDPDALIQIVWSEDVAQAILLALKKRKAGAFNLVADDPLTYRELADKLHKNIFKLPYNFLYHLLKVTYKLQLHKYDPGWISITRYPVIVSNQKAKKQLGWDPRFTTFEAILAYLKSKESA
jgi:nucleoside-diphosphate-sugar epimerase